MCFGDLVRDPACSAVGSLSFITGGAVRPGVAHVASPLLRIRSLVNRRLKFKKDLWCIHAAVVVPHLMSFAAERDLSCNRRHVRAVALAIRTGIVLGNR